MKVDILCFGAHPDDVELGCSGTIFKHISIGKKVAIVDLTLGELGSRGNVETRKAEAKKATEIMNVSYRENLGLPDGFLHYDKDYLLQIVTAIRKYQPEIILCNAPQDRHPDHGKAAQLVVESVFLSGLVNIKTTFEGKQQLNWRVKNTFHYIQDYYLKPDLVVDITGFEEQKMTAILAYTSQFYSGNDEKTKSVTTPISSPEFLTFLKARMSEMGRIIHVPFGEGFIAARQPGVNDLTSLV
jgi:N-acetylglucosamine malate deacetylase 1